MNFTREPIIETIISARDGYKLAIKSSKAVMEEEYLVDAIEVVSFGGTFFYRCQEKPKPFFLPATDYDVLEVRETRLLLKNPVIEKSIKIAGGKEAKKDSSENKEREQREPREHRDSKENKAPREPKQEKTTTEESVLPQVEENQPAENSSPEQVAANGRGDQKRDRKRYRKGRRIVEENRPVKLDEKGEPITVPLNFPHLLRPPENLISDSIQKYKKEIGLTSENEKAEQDVAPTATLPPASFEGGSKESVVDNPLISESPMPHESLEEPRGEVFVPHSP